MRIILLAIVLFLPSCTTTVSHVLTAGWPKLAIVEHYVGTKDVRNACQEYEQLGTYIVGCAQFDLKNKTCHIWLNYDYVTTDIVLHERLHCQGYDHPNSTYLKDLLDGYTASAG